MCFPKILFTHSSGLTDWQKKEFSRIVARSLPDDQLDSIKKCVEKLIVSDPLNNGSEFAALFKSMFMKFSLNEPRDLAYELALVAVDDPLFLGSPAVAIFAEVGVDLKLSPTHASASLPHLNPDSI